VTKLNYGITKNSKKAITQEVVWLVSLSSSLEFVYKTIIKQIACLTIYRQSKITLVNYGI